ncbi:MAG TPA: TetR family transcriptional regulator [Jiangellales bacterium]|nr:TetR family transcriptional regulator [Jiangellales bacterium]
MNKPRGRPRGGNSGARERILAEARMSFLERGYGRTTLRGVAAAAAVDPALISYHFGSKQGLFSAAMALNQSPAQILRATLEGPAQTLPERLVAAIVDTWDSPEHGRPLTTLVFAALEDEAAMRAFQEYIEHEIVARLAGYLRGLRATERAGAAVAVIAGGIFSRYILRLPPIADMTASAFKRSMVPPLAAALGRRPPS